MDIINIINVNNKIFYFLGYIIQFYKDNQEIKVQGKFLYLFT